MGKYSNVILIGSDGNIIDSVSVPICQRMRLVQPHLPLYIDPPSQDKLEPTAENIANFIVSRPQYTAGEVFLAPSPAFQSRLRRKPQSMPAALKATCPRCAAKPTLPWP